MGITKDEFRQFELRMDERHAEVMRALSGLPCAEHTAKLADMGKFQLKQGLIFSGLVAIAMWFDDELKGVLRRVIGGAP